MAFDGPAVNPPPSPTVLASVYVSDNPWLTSSVSLQRERRVSESGEPPGDVEVLMGDVEVLMRDVEVLMGDVEVLLGDVEVLVGGDLHTVRNMKIYRLLFKC